MKSLNDNHMRTQRYILEKEQVRFKLQHDPNKKLLSEVDGIMLTGTLMVMINNLF